MLSKEIDLKFDDSLKFLFQITKQTMFKRLKLSTLIYEGGLMLDHNIRVRYMGRVV